MKNANEEVLFIVKSLLKNELDVYDSEIDEKLISLMLVLILKGSIKNVIKL